ncbi:MAG TPA: hypothetical protein VMR45_01120 [Patescibacteria group bacterium]|nr:hypothetical protein [Patescibacteria group bacterium]
MNAENPFDNTPDGKHAIEDPMHGPTAVHNMLQTPPMPLGNGNYYQPGAYYVSGTNYFDANDQPIWMIGMCGSSITRLRRTILELAEWAEASHQGQEALTALEASRQRGRLERTGVAYSFKPSDVCAGGQQISDCEAASSMMQAAQEHAGNANAYTERPDEGIMWNTLAWLGRTCAQCSLNCEVAVQTDGGKPTGITRIANSRPISEDIVTVRLDIHDLRQT